MRRKSNYEYLHHPPELYQLQPRQSQAIGLNLSGQKTRKLFYNVKYNHEQKLKIEQFRKYAQVHHQTLDCDDTQVLRYLYSTNFVFKDCLEKIKVYLDWAHDPTIQTLSNKARAILHEGAIYTYGRDKQNRPVVYMDLTRIKLDRYELNDFYCAINTLLNLVVEECFIHGVIQNYLFVIDMGGKNFGLAIDAIGKIIQKLSIVYSMYLGQMLVVNTPTFIKASYMAIQYFIHEQTRKKIALLNSKQVQKISQFVEKKQLTRKYHGENPDLYEYWPPVVPGVKKVVYYDEQTVYYSVDENDSFFLDKNGSNQHQNQPTCCDQCQGFSCSIF